jgi:hypothetical protein
MSLAVSAKIPIENRKITDVHFDLREFAKNHPRDFFTLYPNKFTKAKVDVLDAQQLELLEYDPETHSWKIWDEKEAFHKVPVNEDPIKDLINFLCNEKDGELAHEMIREAINREEGKYS